MKPTLSEEQQTPVARDSSLRAGAPQRLRGWPRPTGMLAFGKSTYGRDVENCRPPILVRITFKGSPSSSKPVVIEIRRKEDFEKSVRIRGTEQAFRGNVELEVYMTSLLSKLSAALFFFSAVAVFGTNAQLPSNGVEFKAPFPFVIGNATLPPGDYRIKPTQDDPDALIVRGASGHETFAYCDAVDLNSASAKTELSFRKYGTGTTRYLKQILVGDSSQGCAFVTGDAEKKDKKSGSPSKDVVEGKAK